MPGLAAHQQIRNHADNLATGGQRSIGRHSHQADAAAAVDQRPAALGNRAARFARKRPESRLVAGLRTAEDGDRPLAPGPASTPVVRFVPAPVVAAPVTAVPLVAAPVVAAPVVVAPGTRRRAGSRDRHCSETGLRASSARTASDALAAPSRTSSTALADRHVDAELARAVRHRCRQQATPSATWPSSARISSSAIPCGQLQTDRRLRDRSPVQVSTRSPRPASPMNVSRLRRPGDAEAAHLREAARHQRGARVVRRGRGRR